MSSNSSIYWNINWLSQKAAGGEGSPSVLHRRLRATAYSILLDTGEELYRDISEADRPVINVQIAAAELLRLRSEGRHGTAARLSWRLDELADLQQQLQTSGGNGDGISRLVSFLLHVRGSAEGADNGDGRTAVDGGIGVPGRLGARALPASLGLSMNGFMGNAGGGGKGTDGGLDGVPVGRRLRLQPPPGFITPLLALPPPSPASAGTEPAVAASSGANAPNPSSASATAGVTEPSAPGNRSLTARAPTPCDDASAANGWFPFRDAAGLPLAPAFDAPVNLLLNTALGQGWGPGAGAGAYGPAGGNCLALATASLPEPHQAPGRAPQVPPAAAAAAAAADASSVLPLLLGPLQPGLVHTRFGHINPMLLRLSGTQSECFSLPTEAGAAAVAAAATEASSGEADAGAAAVEGSAGGSGGVGADRRGLARESSGFPVPYALAALGVSADYGAAPPPAGSSLPLRSPADMPPSAVAAPGEGALATGRLGKGPAVLVKGPSAAFGVVTGVRSKAEDEVLVYDMAAMALQGIASAQWMLRSGMVRSHCVRMASQRRLMSQICDTGELRLRLGNFVASYGTYGTASINGWAQQDEALAAFADAVRELLVMYDGELQELAASNRSGLKVARPVGPNRAPANPCTAGRDAGGSTCNGKNGNRAATEAATAGDRSAGGGGGGGLLGLFLSLSPLRIHLQRLADVCMCVPDPAWIPPPGAAAARDRMMGRQDGGASSVYDGRVPPIAPSLWQVYGFPQGAELLDRLYRTLLQTDHAKTPLLRLLFAATAAPYLRRVRAWLYDTVEASAAAAAVAGATGSNTPAPAAAAMVSSPPPAPSFAAPMQRLLAAAGLQMRLLQGLDAELGDVAGRIRKMAAFEAEEVRLIAEQYNEALKAALPSSSVPAAATAIGPSMAPAAQSDRAAGGTGHNGGGGGVGAVASPDPVLGLLGGTGAALLAGAAAEVRPSGGSGGGGRGSSAVDEFDYPLVFGLQALQQLAEAGAAAATARDAELSSLLELLDRRRRAAAEAADARALAAAQEVLAAEEAARAAKAAAAEQRRLARARLLAEQRQALDERSARLRAERERRIAEEQALAAEAVLKEHNEAAAALAAELARLRASYGGASYSEGSTAGASALAAGVLGADERAAEAAARLRRCEWREARMALAARRRLLWQGIEAEELAQLREVVAAARDTRTGGAAGPLRLQRPPPPLPRLSTQVPAEATADLEPPEGAAPPDNQAMTPKGPDGKSSAGPLAVAGAAAAAGAAASPPTSRAPSSRSASESASPVKAAGPSRGQQSVPQPRGPGAGTATSPCTAGTSALLSPRASASAAAVGGGGGQPLSIRLSAPAGSAAAAGGLPISPHRFVSPRSPGSGSGSVLDRPRRRTYHDAGPSVGLLSPRGLVMASPALRGRVSDGGASISANSPAASRSGAVQLGSAARHHGGARRSLSVTGASAGQVAWPDDEVGSRGGGPGRPPSAGGWSERGGRPGPQPRGHTPSSRPSSVLRGSASGRVGLGSASGLGGAPGGGGLLLQLQSRRRRWAVPDTTGGSGGLFGLASGGFALPPPAPGPWGPHDNAPSQRPDGAYAVREYGGEDAAQQLLQQEEVEGTQGLGQPLAVAGGKDAGGTAQPGGGGGGLQQRRRALWRVPPANEAGGGAEGGALTATPYGELSDVVYGVAGAVSPVKALLRSYLRETRESDQQATDGLQQAKPASAVQLWANQLAAGLEASAPHASGLDASGADADAGALGYGGISEDLAYAPVGVAVQTCLYGSVLAQYRLTTRAVWHVLVHEYRLAQFCMALRRFFFCEAGDVAGSLADSLMRRTEIRPHVPPSTAELRAMLDEALQGSSLLAPTAASRRLPGWGRPLATRAGTATGEGSEGDGAAVQAQAIAYERPYGGAGGCCRETAMVAQLLSVRSVPRRKLDAEGYFASDVMLVTCEVPPPLDAVITAPCLSSYSDIFSLLMRVRCAGAVLAACWARLDAASSPLVARELRTGGASGGGRRGDNLDGCRGRGRGQNGRGGGGGVGPAAGGGRGAAVHPLWLKRFSLARLWLQAASQVVTLLMQHLQVELQGRCWSGLAASLQGDTPQDLIQMREAHGRYLDAAREVCMLLPAHSGASSGGGAQPQQHLVALGPPLMEVLQSTHAMATVLRRALGALEVQACSQPEGLSMPPRQPTVAPMLPGVSRPMQTGLGLGREGDFGAESGGDRVREGLAEGGAVGRGLELDELWAHVVACQTRLGRAMGDLHDAVRSRGGVGGLLGEVAGVLACEPCRGFTGGGGGGVGRATLGG